jgi:hypothetical protein
VSIRGMQTSLAEMGRIRLGQRVPTAKGGTRPAKLDTFRFTSPARALIEEIAALYGGTASEFTGEGVRGKQFQVTTEHNVIPVFVPRQTIDPFYESWARGVCTRRCNGEHDLIHDNPCDCNPEKRACKPTTRVNLMLSDVSGPGYWRLESHGIYAAMELTQIAQLIQRVEIPLPAKLLLEARQRKFFNREEGKVETHDWFTPVVILDHLTPRMLITGGTEAVERAVQSGGAAPAPALEGAAESRALPAAPPPAPAGPKQWDPAVIERAMAAIASAQPEGMADLHQRVQKLGHEGVLAAFQARLAEHELERQAKAAALEAEQNREQEQYDAARAGEADGYADAWNDDEAQETPAPPAESAPAAPEEPAAPSAPADTEPPAGDDMGDRSAAMTELLGVAAKLRMGVKALDGEIERFTGVSRYDASADRLRALAAELSERLK